MNTASSRRLTIAVTSLLISVATSNIGAASFPLPADNSHVVGAPVTMVAAAEDTFTSIALKYQVGFDALAAANPKLNPWFPGAGTRITLPSQYILPDTSFEGIVVNLPELRLYYFPPDTASVYVYPVGIGRTGWETPLADTEVTRVVDNPDWRPPQSIIKEYQNAGLYLPPVVPAGPENPLGDTAIRLSLAGYLLHGTNRPEGVGMKVSHGCIRLYPKHIRELASMVTSGTRVRIINQPVKWGSNGQQVLVEAHRVTDSNNSDATVARASLVDRSPELRDWLAVRRQHQQLFNGLPQLVGE